MESKNVATLRAAHDAFSAHDCARSVATLAGPTIKLVDHGRGMALSSQQAMQAWLEGFVAMSSNIKIVDAQYIDAGDWVTARFRAVGIQDGPMPSEFPASHRPYSLDVCEVWHFGPDGRADEGHNYSDGLGLMMQLGHIPAPQA
ncbi:MAG: nuclear transport factor 2 family protein [Caldilineaceae bacterium]|nr:nuclear transport factor 2 family protein [Caldilineaceae bacterium]